MAWLKGKKTILGGVVTIIFAVSAVLLGEMEVVLAGPLILYGWNTISQRLAVKKLEK